jgi:hypothetical protein
MMISQIYPHWSEYYVSKYESAPSVTKKTLEKRITNPMCYPYLIFDSTSPKACFPNYPFQHAVFHRWLKFVNSPLPHSFVFRVLSCSLPRLWLIVGFAPVREPACQLQLDKERNDDHPYEPLPLGSWTDIERGVPQHIYSTPDSDGLERRWHARKLECSTCLRRFGHIEICKAPAWSASCQRTLDRMESSWDGRIEECLTTLLICFSLIWAAYVWEIFGSLMTGRSQNAEDQWPLY